MALTVDLETGRRVLADSVRELVAAVGDLDEWSFLGACTATAGPGSIGAALVDRLEGAM